jgi:aubergine-like protein
VVVYRDGVGDGQIEYVKEQEIAMIKKVFVENNFEPTFTYIIVSKRINSRFFKMDRQGPVNPPSGSIIDDVVTLPERYDFFLISQSVRQGTVNPTSYNVIEDSSKWPAKNLQSLTYKLTHLYFNWPGTVIIILVNGQVFQYYLDFF